MPLSLVTAPAVEPLTLDDAKAQCRVETDDENGLLVTLIEASRQAAEAFTKRALIAQTWDLKLCGFFEGDYYQDGALWLPFPPVSAVSAITYRDTAGSTQTWSSSDYETDLPSGPTARRARIAPVFGESWPSTYDALNAVTVRFVCGYGTTAESVPAGIRQGMQLLVAHWYARREPVQVGSIVNEIPLTISHLWWPFRAF